MSLEQRGYRPKPHERGLVAAFIQCDLDRKFRQRLHIEMAVAFHQVCWGVPCGPTLSMVNRPRLRGIVSMGDVLTAQRCAEPDHPAPFFCRECGDRSCCCTCHLRD